MLLDLKKIFLQEGASRSFQYDLDLSSEEINGVHPFISPAAVSGTAENRAGCVQLTMQVSFLFAIPCDRCTETTEKRYEYSFSHALAASLEDDENTDYIPVEHDMLDVDELVRADVLLELPSRFLCREDCAGLCPVCGKNRNHGPCGCETCQIDPRLEVLRKLID